VVKKAILAAALATAVLVLNPLYFFHSKERGFNFDARDMRAAVEGTWMFTLPETDKIYYVEIEQAAQEQRSTVGTAISSAHACGSRTLVKTASACEVETLMPLTVRLLATTDATSGSFEVYGPTFQSGSLKLSIDNHLVYARLDHTGIATDVSDGGLLLRIAR
jgi:hypothetical protein